jgi:ABC-type phosphate/phosphonate transport system substrate-binding protein
MKRILSFPVVLVGLWFALHLPGQAVAQAPGSTIQLGFATSLVPGATQSFLDSTSPHLKSLIQIQTGHEGELSLEGDVMELAEAVHKGKVHFGVFHGHEFAWVKSRYPTLTPLVVPVKHNQLTPVCLVVKSDGKYQKPDDLKGERLEIPYRSKGYVYLFLERKCCPGADLETFFRKVRKSNQPEGALSSLLDGYAQAAVVEKDDLDSYLRSNPGAAGKLRVLLQSEPFPPGVLVYNKGALSEDAVRRFHDGLISAHKNEKCRSLLDLSELRGFEEVPDNYHQMLADILKAYPQTAKK